MYEGVLLPKLVQSKAKGPLIAEKPSWSSTGFLSYESKTGSARGRPKGKQRTIKPTDSNKCMFDVHF